MTTRTYASVLATIEALAGSGLATSEQARLNIFINRRARKAYAECEYWPRFLVAAEERQISATGFMTYAETSLDEIDTILRLHSVDPYKNTLANEYVQFHAKADGIQVTGYEAVDHSVEASPIGGIYATYKAVLSATYGTGTGDTQVIPAEWADYIIQGSYADWLRSEGQQEKGALAEAEADVYMTQQLEKISRQGGDMINTRITTHSNTQIRTR